MKRVCISMLLLATVTSVFSREKGEKDTPLKSERKSFLDPSTMDPSVKPGDDFWMYANGAWYKKISIPPTETRVGTFNDLFKASRPILQKLCEEAVKAAGAKGSVAQQIGDMYASGMDSIKIEQLGYTPIKPFLQQIATIKDTKQLMEWVAGRHAQGSNYIYGFGVVPDAKNASMMICDFLQGGLGMPDRDYYFKTDEKSKEIRNKYTAYITQLFTLTGDDNAIAAKSAAAVVALEAKIAEGHFTNIELRDPEKNYNKLSLSDLGKLAPGIDWKSCFDIMQIKQDSFVVDQTKFFQNLSTILTKVPIDDWKQYLRFHVINNAAPALSKAFNEAKFDFYGRTLNGQRLQNPRSERIALGVNGTLGEALGQLYVKKYFNENAKERMMNMINNMQQVYARRIKALDWMSNETKDKALAKLSTFIKKIGYPDKWKAYKVDIDRNDYYGNLLRFKAWQYADKIVKQGKPVDKTEWEMTPPTINAYYNPLYNEIVFPAGILQFPFFDLNADDAINYGGIGMVIGHEMTHGFDDQGAQFDKDGNLKNWWAEEDNKKFKEKVDQVIKQYDAYTVLDTLHIKGALTVGENLADIGGLAIAYEAFKNTEQGRKNEKIDGFTADQRFFLSFAQIWREKTKDEFMRQQVLGDPHSPDIWRVNGPLANFTPWYNAFGIKEGDKLYKPEAERIKVW